MSHPFYNPYAPGNHNPTQGQYGHSNTPPERDPRGPPSFLGPGSRFSSFGASPVIPENSGQTVSASLNYRPEPSRAIRDEDTKSSIDMHIGRAREGAWPPGTPLHQPMDQGTRFTSTQRDDFRSPGASYAMTTASASLGHKHEVDIGSGSSNLNRLTNYIRPSTDGSILKSSSALSNYARIADGRLNNPDEREHGMQTIPGLGDYDRSASDKPSSSTEPFQPMYTYESAASILLQFGLEKEDLEHLISYPEDQITPANLPFILRQIRLQKDKSAATAVQSKAYLEPQLTRTMSSGGAVDKTSSAVLQPSNVIDYGHTSKYAAGVGDEIGRKIDRDNSGGSGNLFVMDTDERHCREPLQINTPEFKSSALGSSSEQARSSTTLSSMYGSVLRPVDSPSSDQTKPWQVQPKRTFQDILNSFSQLKKDSDMSALKSEASKLASLSQQEVHPQSILKTQPPSTRTHGTHPSRPGLVLIGSKTPGQRPTVPVKSHQASQQPIQQTQKQPVKKAKNQSLKQVSKQPVQKQPLKQQQSKKQMQQHQKHPVSQKGQVLPTGVLARLVKLATSKGQPKNEAVVSKDQPTPEMMFDYAAASPRIFPHTCVLCNKECTDLKDWIAHQNSSLHLESCTRLRKQYPKWDGGITLGPRAAGKDAKTPSSTSAKKTRHGSRSRSKSVSPHRRRGSEGRRDKRRSRSRSPQSSKYSGRYDGPATSSYRSRSQSPERRSSPRRKDDRQSSPRRTRDRRSPLRRSNESWSPPRNRWSPPRKGDAIRGDERWTPPRRPEGGWSPLRRASERQSPSRRSSDSRSPTRRVESRWSPPKRFDKRRSPQRRVDDRWSPPRRAGGGRSPPGRSAGSRSPPGRSQERRSSREGSSPQRKASNSAESLAKKLLETSAAQSLSNKSDLETMVKTLAPALLAELAKMTSSSSSSSSLKGGKRSLPASSLRRKKLSSSAASSTFSSSAAKRKRSATIPSKAMRLLKSEVRLKGIHEGISQDDVVTAVEHFGKTKFVNLYRSKSEAIARFEKEEDANRLKILKFLDVKGGKVTVVIEKVAVTKKQIKPPLKKPTASGVSTKTATSMKALLPTPNIPPLMSLFHSGANQGAARKLVNQKPGAKNSAKAIKTVNKAKVLVSMAKNISTKMVAKNVKTAKLPVKEEEKTDLAKQETSSGSNSTSPENQSDTGDSKEELVPENAATTSKEVGMKDAVEVDKSANRTVSEPAEAPPIGERVPVSQAETQAATDVSVPSKSADSENPTHVESLKLNQPETKVPESLEVHKETAESGKASPPTVVKLQGIGSSLSHSDVLSAVKHFGKTKSVILVRARLEAVVIFEKEEDARKLKSVRSLNVNGTEITVITEKETVSKEEKPLLLRPPVSCGASTPASSSAKVLLPSPSTPKAGLEKASAQQKPKPPEDQLPAGEAATKEHVEATAAKDARKPTNSTADIQADGENSKPQESLVVSEDTAQAVVKVVEHTDRAKVDRADDAGEPMELGGSGVKFDGNSEPGSTAQGPETRTEVSQVQQQAAGSKNDAAAVEAVMPGGGTETQTTQEGPLTAGGSQMDSASTKEACQVPSVSTEVSKQPSAAVVGLTIGEMLEKHLFPKDINAWQPYCLSQTLPYGYKQLLISGLPMYYPGFYTETDVANLLLPLGFQNKEDKLFVIPQARMAFVTMPAVENVLHLTRTAAQSGFFFRGTRLVFEVINIRYPLTAAQFYTYLKKVLKCSVTDEVERTVLIWNISQSGIRHLREALKEFGPVTNFMPLLNKLFVEFEFVEDADRFEGWYSEVKQTAGSKVVRLKGPNVNSQSLRPVPAGTTQADAASAKDASKTDGKVSAGTEKPGTSEAAPSAAEVESKEGVAEVAIVPSKSEASGKQPDLGDSEVKPESSGAGAGRQEKSADITDSETESATQKHQISAEELAAKEADTGIKGLGVLLKDSEEVGLASQAETVSTTQEPNTQADKLGANAASSEHVGRSNDANEPMEVAEPGCTEPTGRAPQEHQQAAEEAAVEAETGTTQTEMTQMDSTSTKEASGASAPPLGKDSVAASSVKTKAAAAAASRSSSSAVTWPTIGEMLDKYLFPKSIHTLVFPHVTALSYNQQLLICGLPTYHDGCYTEDDIADLLVPFGFKNKQEKLYVITQTRMAFATMPSLANVYEILKEYKQKGVYFREKRLSIHIVRLRYQMKLHQFYRFLKKVMKCSAIDEVERTFFIRNISQRETRELREALKEFGAVKNFMPLLNKLFVEFQFVEDADRFEGWYSEVKQTAGQEVIRLKMHGPVAAMATQTAIAKDANLTFGEMFENHLSRKIIASFKSKSGTSTKMLISWLPAYSEGSYTENDLIELLTPFGYQHKDHNIYVAPQASLAFVLMPTAGDVSDIIRASRRDPIIFKESELRFHALDNTISMRPFWFYESLMTRLDYCMNEDRDAVIFIRDISPTETRELREALTKMGSIRNFLPLLNKVFVVFQTACDADWLGVWYSLLRQAPGYRIQRLKIPLSTSSPPSPMVPKDCLLDSKDLIDGVTVPSAKVAIPQFSPSPFWISLRNSPFVFPTISPWFIIPEYQTVKGLFDIEKASRRGSMCPTIMLTGLPEGNYKHEDVARLVWPYFPKQTLHSLYYNVTVLPLQRRAFVFFSDWTTCSDFVAAHVAKRVSLKGRIVGVHFVLQNMYPESSEEMMYRSLMKWSNAGVPDPTSLEERLLCVEVSEVSLDIITLVIEMVASIATFVNFLPLANRICIEMTDSSGVTEVVEKYKDPSPNSFTADPAWSRVKNFESLQSLKQRLQDSAEVTINLDKPGATVGRDEAPEMDEDMLKAITVTVGKNRLVQKSRSQSAERQGEDDFTDDLVSSDAYLFDEEQFNEEEFVTVDEVYDDVEDLSPEPRRYSSSKHSSRERGERQSSGGSSSHHRTSTRSSRDYKSSASSSRSNKGSRSDPKHSSKPTKSSTKTSSSASASKASSLPPPVWTESPSSLDKKTQQSSTKSPLKSSSTKREKIEASVEPVREGAKDTESAVAKSDHRVSAEGTAAKYVESEAEIETTREMHPAQQEHGSDLNQAQHLEIDLDTNKTQRTSKEDDTHTEEVDNSSDGQTDERMEECGQDGSSAPQLTGSEGGQVVDRDEGPLQARDSGATTSQGDSGLVQRDGSTSKQLSEEGSGPTADQSDENPAVKVEDAESLQDHSQESDDKPNLRHPDSDGTDQEAFEILDSIDDQTQMEEKQIPKDDNGPAEDGEEAYEVIDSVGDQPTTTESESEQKQQRPRRGRTASRKDDRPSRRSGPTSKAAEESPKRQDRTVKAPEARPKMDKKAALFEIVDSVEEVDAASRESSGRRRSTRGKPEEVTYEILDSVENEPVAEEPTITTRRSTRGKRGRTAEDASTGKTKEEDAPTGRRQTAPREKTPKKDEKAPPKESERVGAEGDPREEVATYEVLDSVEDEVLNDQPVTRGKGKRGRPKRQVKAALKKDGATSEKVAKEEATYRILDSVEDESVDDQPPSDQSGNKSKESVSKNATQQDQDRTSLKGSTKKAEEEEEEEEEPLFQIVDSLEDDQVQEELAPTEVSDGAKTGEESPREEGEIEDTQTCRATVVEASEELVEKEEILLQRVDELEEGNEGSDTGEKERTSPGKCHGDTAALEREKSPEKEQTPSTLVSLDEVSDEEEDYPDDREEEEELRRRQAVAKEKRFPKEHDVRGRREERERRSRSDGSRGGGGDDGRRSKRGKEDERAEVDAREMVTLDEVGADEAKDETAPERRVSDEEEARALVTLDEFVDEEAEEKAEPIKVEARPLGQEDESVDDLNQETLVTLDEACCDEEDKLHDEQAEETLGSSKRKHHDDTEEGMNFVIVDEVKDEEKEETSTPRTRGRPKKRTRLTPVRKSTRGKNVVSHEEEKEPSDDLPPSSLEASSSMDKDASKLSNVGEQAVQKAAEVEAMTQADIDTASADPELQPEDKTLEKCAEISEEEEREEKSRTDIKDASKKRRDAVGPEAKRSRSQSPSVPADFKLPEFKPNNPLGKEFVVPGYFCKLCSVFYKHESTAKELHCSSQTHFNNLQKHYRELQQKAGSSTPSCQGSFPE